MGRTHPKLNSELQTQGTGMDDWTASNPRDCPRRETPRAMTTHTNSEKLFPWHAGICVVCFGMLLTSNLALADEPLRQLPLPIRVVPTTESEPGETLPALPATVEPPVTPETPDGLATPGENLATGIARVAHHQSVVSSASSPGIPRNATRHIPGIPLRVGGSTPSREALTSRDDSFDPGRRSGWNGMAKVGGSLAVVMGVLLGLVWVSRRVGATRSLRLPDEVVQVLGRVAMGPRQQVYVVRFGSKLMAWSVTPTGIETLGELDDSIEVQALTHLCQIRDPRVLPEKLRNAADRYAAFHRS